MFVLYSNLELNYDTISGCLPTFSIVARANCSVFESLGTEVKRIETRIPKKKLASIIEEKLQDIELELHDIEYHKEKDGQVLRIFIDKESGIDLNTCSEATRLIKNLIEENDVFYDFLEVSSPGTDRALTKERDFIRFKGSKIKVKTLELFNGLRKLTGVLYDFNEREIIIENDQELTAIPREIISVVRLDPDE